MRQALFNRGFARIARASILLGAFSVTVSAFAEESGLRKEALPSACQAAKEKFCAENSDTLLCLAKHQSEIDEPCQQELTRVFERRKAAAEAGGGAISAFAGTNLFGPVLPMFSYQGRISPGDESSRELENKASLSLPVFHADRDSVSASLSAGQVRLGDDLHLDSGYAVPDVLDRFEIGAQYFHQLDDKKSWGAKASFGYAGDGPFESSSSYSYSFSASYGFPGSGDGYWILLVFVSNDSPLLNYIPIPGVEYIFKGRTVSGMLGFPVSSVQWSFADPWVFSASFLGPTVQSEIAYGHLEKIQPFVGYQLAMQSFIPNERPVDDYRLTLQEQKVDAGFRFLLLKRVLAEVQAGYSYDRTIRLGDGLLNHDGGTTSLLADFYAAWSLKILL